MRVLIIDARKHASTTIASRLKTDDLDTVMDTVGGFAAVLPPELAQSVDAIIVDASPTQSEDSSIPARLRRGGWHGPILVLGSRADPASVISTLAAGADDYLARAIWRSCVPESKPSYAGGG